MNVQKENPMIQFTKTNAAILDFMKILISTGLNVCNYHNADLFKKAAKGMNI